jgi:hypothetical protein
MTNKIIIIIYGGIIMYSIMIMIQIFVYKYSNKKYIEMEIRNRNNKNVYWTISNISIIIIITLISHIIIKIGINSSILYNICYWLIGTGLGLYIIPFIVYGNSIINYIMHSYSYNILITSKNTMYTGTNYKNRLIVTDISIVLTIIRSIYYIMNWMYQVIYYGVRMWLVFVLHEFSLGSFGSLMTVVSDSNIIINIFYFGILGMGIIIYIIVIFYLGIQIYVYISFSIYFLSSCILSLINDIQNNKLVSVNDMIRYNYIVPVSLVDVVNINIIIYVVLLLSILVICIRIILGSSINYTKNINNNNSKPYKTYIILNLLMSSGLYLSSYMVSKVSILLHIVYIYNSNSIIIVIMLFYLLYPLIFIVLIDPNMISNKLYIYNNSTILSIFILGINMYIIYIIISGSILQLVSNIMIL